MKVISPIRELNLNYLWILRNPRLISGMRALRYQTTSLPQFLTLLIFSEGALFNLSSGTASFQRCFRNYNSVYLESCMVAEVIKHSLTCSIGNPKKYWQRKRDDWHNVFWKPRRMSLRAKNSITKLDTSFRTVLQLVWRIQANQDL